MDSPWLQSKRERDLRMAMAREDLIPEQRETLSRLERFWRLRGLSPASRLNYVTYGQRLGRFLGKPFERTTKADIENYLVEYAASHTGKSVANQKIFLKTFYKALLAPHRRGHPAVVSWIAVGRAEARDRKPSDLLTPDEIRRLALATTNPRDRALVLVMYESAARAGELINLRVGDVEFRQYCARITLRGKTGQRPVLLIRSARDLQTWLEDHHPYRENPDAPLFLSLGHQNWHKPLLHDGLRQMLENAQKAAGIRKRVHAHLFRHSRLTELAKVLKEAELNVFAGWAGDSRMSRIYVHLSSDDVERKLLQHAGLLKPELESQPDPLAPKDCLRCRRRNSSTDRLCRNCNVPLEEKDLLRMAEQQERLVKNQDVLSRLMDKLEDPRIREILDSAPGRGDEQPA